MMHFYSTILILVFAVHQYMKYLNVSKMHQHNFCMFSTFLLPSCTFPDFITWYHVSSPNRFIDSILRIRLPSFWLCPSSCIIKKCFRNLICSNHHTKGQGSMYWVLIDRDIISHHWFSCVFLIIWHIRQSAKTESTLLSTSCITSLMP